VSATVPADASAPYRDEYRRTDGTYAVAEGRRRSPSPRRGGPLGVPVWARHRDSIAHLGRDGGPPYVGTGPRVTKRSSTRDRSRPGYRRMTSIALEGRKADGATPTRRPSLVCLESVRSPRIAAVRWGAGTRPTPDDTEAPGGHSPEEGQTALEQGTANGRTGREVRPGQPWGTGSSGASSGLWVDTGWTGLRPTRAGHWRQPVGRQAVGASGSRP
jgi:hypothetical protein